MRQTDGPSLLFDATGECENLFDELGATSGVEFENAQHVDAAFIGRPIAKKLNGGHHRRQHIVQIVSNPAGKSADAFKTLGSQQLLLQSFLLGKVAYRPVDASDGVTVEDRLHLKFNPSNRPV